MKWPKIEKSGKVVIEGDEILIIGFTFNACTFEVAKDKALLWAYDQLIKKMKERNLHETS